MAADDQAMFGRGAYLVTAAGCNDCHTHPDRNYAPGPGYLSITTADYLAGGRVFETPPGLGPVFMQARSMSADLAGGGDAKATLRAPIGINPGRADRERARASDR